jgi:hypothetical protein
MVLNALAGQRLASDKMFDFSDLYQFGEEC